MMLRWAAIFFVLSASVAASAADVGRQVSLIVGKGELLQFSSDLIKVVVAEPKNLGEITTAYGEQRRDLALIETADHMRSLAGPADLLARIETTRFGMTVFDTEAESVEGAWARMYAALLQHRILIGAAVFSNDQPATLDELLEQAARDLYPNALAVGQVRELPVATHYNSSE